MEAGFAFKLFVQAIEREVPLPKQMLERIPYWVLFHRLDPGEQLAEPFSGMVFIASGLLKAYVVHGQHQPVIVRFIPSGRFTVLVPDHLPQVLRAVLPTSLLLVGFQAMLDAYHLQPELLSLYRMAIQQNMSDIQFRYRLLEERFAEQRIRLFLSRHAGILPYLKKKDIANYLHLDYNYFVRLYSRMV